MNRRSFLKLGAGAAGSAALPASANDACAAVASAPPRALSDGDLALLGDASWHTIRALFAAQGRYPLNAANLCPASEHVLARHFEYATQLSQNVSLLHRREFVEERVERSREKVCGMLGVSDSQALAFVRNTTEANAVIVAGLDLAPEDEVLLWDQNHATNYTSWHHRHQRVPFRCRSFSLPVNPSDEQEIIDAIVAEMTPRTRVVSFSHLSNLTGLRLPAKEICTAVRDSRSDVFIHVDGAQSWGSMAVDLERIGCDAYSASGHKWLCGPRGSGILYVRPERVAEVQPLINGHDFLYDYPYEEISASSHRFECTGQRDTAVYGALGDAVDLYSAVGGARIEGRIQQLTRYAVDAFEEQGMRTVTPLEPRFGHGVVVADVGGKWKSYGAFLALHNAGLAAAFTHGNEIHCSPQGLNRTPDLPVYLRLSPNYYNSTDDIDEAVAIAARIRDSNLEILREAIRFL